MNLPLLRFRSSIKGALTFSPPYNPILPSGDSSPYFGTFEGQKYGPYDTMCCWDFSGAEVVETRLKLLLALNLVPQDTVNWLNKLKFIDSDGDPYVSRLWIAILSGVRSKGNSQQNFWDLARVAGVIPNWMLPYDASEAEKCYTRADFDNSYFNPNKITAEMEQVGEEFARRFDVFGDTQYGGFLPDVADRMSYLLKEGSIQIGHPVPQDGSWNQQFVNYPIGRTQADHATEAAKLDMISNPTYPLYDFDSYQPNLKQLSSNYYIPFITRVAITPKPVISLEGVQPTSSKTLWEKIVDFIDYVIKTYGNYLSKRSNP